MKEQTDEAPEVAEQAADSYGEIVTDFDGSPVLDVDGRAATDLAADRLRDPERDL